MSIQQVNRAIAGIFHAIWTVWCGVTFAVMAFSMFPILYIGVKLGGPKTIRALHFLPCYCATAALWLWGIRIEEHNKQVFNSKQQYIFVCNHRSYLDALIAGSIIPNYKKFIGKAEILKWPVLGFLLKTFYIPVDRDDRDHRHWSMDQLFIKAQEGASIVILPEGTCNTSHELLKHFHDGAFKLGIGTKIPIVVFTVIGAGELWPRNKLVIKPGKLKVYWSKAIQMENYSSLDQMNDLKELVREEMLQYLEAHYPKGYE
jgi:1-acyl-sn-glycerol-3-phosphate acyltransferase